jgi:hypothetical protein
MLVPRATYLVPTYPRATWPSDCYLANTCGYLPPCLSGYRASLPNYMHHIYGSCSCFRWWQRTALMTRKSSTDIRKYGSATVMSSRR